MQREQRYSSADITNALFLNRSCLKIRKHKSTYGSGTSELFKNLSKPVMYDGVVLNQIVKKILLKRLREKGIAPHVIPGFISSLVNTIRTNPRMNLLRLNKRLHFLGWDGFELDYHTLQLALALFEEEGIQDLTSKTSSFL